MCHDPNLHVRKHTGGPDVSALEEQATAELPPPAAPEAQRPISKAQKACPLGTFQTSTPAWHQDKAWCDSHMGDVLLVDVVGRLFFSILI